MAVRRGISLLAIAVGSLSALSGCGGGSDHPHGKTAAATGTTESGPPAAVAAKANANCREMVSETTRLASGLVRKHGNSFTGVTAILAQGIPILERFANHQRALERDAHSSAYDEYVQLFDPTIVLLQQRLQAGKANDLARSNHLNSLVAGLSVEQTQAARNAGLAGCDVDFRHVVEQAALG